MSISSVSNSSNANTSKRYTGLSGLDVESLVNAGLVGIKGKINKTKQSKETLEIQQELYRGVITDLTNFYDKYLNSVSSDSIVNTSNFVSVTYSSKSATKSIAKATASSTVGEVSNFKVDVESLAKGASKILKLEDLTWHNTIKIKYLDEVREIQVGSCTSEEQLAQTINNKIKDMGMTAKYSEFAGGVVITTNETGKKIEKDGKAYNNIFEISAGNSLQSYNVIGSSYKNVKGVKELGVGDFSTGDKLKIVYKGKCKFIDFSKCKNAEEIAQTINDSTKDIGITAEYSAVNGKVLIKTVETGDKVTEGGKTYDNNYSLTFTQNKNMSFQYASVYEDNRGFTSKTLKLSDIVGQDHISIASTVDKKDDQLINIAGCDADEIVAVINEKLKDSSMTAVYSKDSGTITFSIKPEKAKIDGKENKFSLSTYSMKVPGYEAKISYEKATIQEIKPEDIKNNPILRVAYQGKSYDIDCTKCKSTIDIVNTLNERLNSCGMVANYSDATGKITINITNEGDTVKSSEGITYKNKFSLELANVSKDTATDKYNYSLNLSDNVEAGSDLKATISKEVNGKWQTISYGIGSNSKVSGKNKVSIDGVTFELTGIGTIELEGEKNVSGIKDKIVGFVKDYNTLLEKLNTLVNEKRDRNYQPLTDEQKDNMTEEQIKKWNNKVRTGQLARDSDITQIINSLKYAMQDVVSDCGLTLGGIGITTVKNYDNKAGTLTIDEFKLEKALKENTEEVAKMFTNYPLDSKTLSENELYHEKGIFRRIQNIIDKSAKDFTRSPLIKKAGTTTIKDSTISKKISDYESRIKSLNKEYDKKQQSLYSKYSKYESLLNKYNNQMSYLSSSFGGN